ncbi:MAG TPA: allantoinase AllB [Tepidisphaeraceae bacterium]|nr:allantoinase AllB [Tepidisphaeraceae bacterium]
MPSYDLIIRNGQLVTARDVVAASIAVADGKIVELTPEIAGTAREEIDATGLHVFPGVIDPHVHFNEPGRTEWEGIATGSAALAAGGGTCFFDMPLNSSPPVLDGESFDAKLAAASQKSLTDFALWGGLTPNNLEHLDELAERGVIGFKAFMCDSGIDEFAWADDYTLYRGMVMAEARGLPVAVHAENQALTQGLAREASHARRESWFPWIYARPIIAEIEAIGRAILLAEETGCRLHVVHVSCGLGVDLVVDARRRGLPVTCETCPHYLTFSVSDLEALGTLGKCAPPLRWRPDQRALWSHLSEGGIDFVASDHSPSPPQMKAVDFADAWGGIAGVQSTLSTLLTPRSDEIAPLPLPRIAALVASNAAAVFKLPGKGDIRAGADADLCLVDLNRGFELREQDLHDRHKLSPYVGQNFRGVVRRTLVRGMTAFRDGKIVSGPLGRLVRPA